MQLWGIIKQHPVWLTVVHVCGATWLQSESFPLQCFIHPFAVHTSVVARIQEDHLSALPDEVIDKLFDYLDLQSLVQLSSVNSRWCEGIQNNKLLWKRLCKVYDISGQPENQTQSNSWKVGDVTLYVRSTYLVNKKRYSFSLNAG